MILRAIIGSLWAVILLATVAQGKEIFFTFEWPGPADRLQGFEVQILHHNEDGELYVFEMPVEAPCDPALNSRPGARCGYLGCVPSGDYDLVVIVIATGGQRSELSNRFHVPGHVADESCSGVEPALFTGFVESETPEAPALPLPPELPPYIPIVVNLRCPFAK